jgi:hypothetical protein
MKYEEPYKQIWKSMLSQLVGGPSGSFGVETEK